MHAEYFTFLMAPGSKSCLVPVRYVFAECIAAACWVVTSSPIITHVDVLTAGRRGYTGWEFTVSRFPSYGNRVWEFFTQSLSRKNVLETVHSARHCCPCLALSIIGKQISVTPQYQISQECFQNLMFWM
jgi:hypothetical protein